MISPDTVFDAIEEAGQCAFYVIAGAAIFVGTCWAVSSIVVSKSLGVVRRKKD